MESGISGGNRISNDSFTYKMTINFDVFCILMKNKIGRIWSVAWLSQYNLIGLWWKAPRGARKYHNHNNSEAVLAIAWYSTSIVNWEIVDCFFIFHENGWRPKKYKIPSRRWTYKRTTCPNWIIESIKLYITLCTEENTLARCSFDILKKSNDGIVMSFLGLLHKLRKNMYNIA